MVRLLSKGTSAHAPRIISVSRGQRIIWRSTATEDVATDVTASEAAAVTPPVADASSAPAASAIAEKEAAAPAAMSLVFAELAPLLDGDGVKVRGQPLEGSGSAF